MFRPSNDFVRKTIATIVYENLPLMERIARIQTELTIVVLKKFIKNIRFSNSTEKFAFEETFPSLSKSIPQ
jgi:hypothetical protein